MFALGDAKVLNANGFVAQWNIGFKVCSHVIMSYGMTLKFKGTQLRPVIGVCKCWQQFSMGFDRFRNICAMKYCRLMFKNSFQINIDKFIHKYTPNVSYL